MSFVHASIIRSTLTGCCFPQVTQESPSAEYFLVLPDTHKVSKNLLISFSLLNLLDSCCTRLFPYSSKATPLLLIPLVTLPFPSLKVPSSTSATPRLNSIFNLSLSFSSVLPFNPYTVLFLKNKAFSVELTSL